MSRPGGASLDGEPPASALPQPSREPRRSPTGAEAPDVHVCGPAQSWRSPDRRLLRAEPPAGGVLDRSSGLRHDLWRPRQCPPADTALLPHPRRRGARGADPPPPRQRRRPAPFPDAFHRRVPPPPVTPDACASCAWDRREPATGVAARVLMAFATTTRLPAPFHLLSFPRASERASRLDPDLSIRTERRSSTSATNSNREHGRDPPDPRPSHQGATGVRLRAPPASPSGVPPPRDRTERRSRSLAGRPIPVPGTGSAIDPQRGAGASRRHTDGTEAPSGDVESTATSRGFTGQGLDEPKLWSSVTHRRLSPPAARSRLPLRALREGVLPQPDPLGHLSS